VAAIEQRKGAVSDTDQAATEHKTCALAELFGFVAELEHEYKVAASPRLCRGTNKMNKKQTPKSAKRGLAV
jgi:hypothetical protein